LLWHALCVQLAMETDLIVKTLQLLAVLAVVGLTLWAVKTNALERVVDWQRRRKEASELEAKFDALLQHRDGLKGHVRAGTLHILCALSLLGSWSRSLGENKDAEALEAEVAKIDARLRQMSQQREDTPLVLVSRLLTRSLCWC
jgi:hypothetical protein